jgi:hypothetical protein
VDPKTPSKASPAKPTPGPTPGASAKATPTTAAKRRARRKAQKAANAPIQGEAAAGPDAKANVPASPDNAGENVAEAKSKGKSKNKKDKSKEEAVDSAKPDKAKPDDNTGLQADRLTAIAKAHELTVLREPTPITFDAWTYSITRLLLWLIVVLLYCSLTKTPTTLMEVVYDALCSTRLVSALITISEGWAIAWQGLVTAIYGAPTLAARAWTVGQAVFWYLSNLALTRYDVILVAVFTLALIRPMRRSSGKIGSIAPWVKERALKYGVDESLLAVAVAAAAGQAKALSTTRELAYKLGHWINEHRTKWTDLERTDQVAKCQMICSDVTILDEGLLSRAEKASLGWLHSRYNAWATSS